MIGFQTGEIKKTIQVADQAISADLVLAKKQYVLLGTLSGVCASVHTGTNTVAWRGTLSSPVFAGPVLYDNDKYVVFAEVNGEIHCRTVEKGIKVITYLLQARVEVGHAVDHTCPLLVLHPKHRN